MFFRHYTNMMSQASRGFAKGLFVIGLLLIGFGVGVYVLKEVFAAIAAAIFIIAGGGCCYNAIKLFFVSRKMRNMDTGFDQNNGYRKNVQIHIKDNGEL
jgi:hypothetical protein